MPLWCGCDNWYHNNDDNASSKTNKEMSNLNDIASLGRELGFYILYTCSLPMAVRNQLKLEQNMTWHDFFQKNEKISRIFHPFKYCYQR